MLVHKRYRFSKIQSQILSMVCHVSLFYTPMTHLPSRHRQLYWSVGTSIELFGVKFTVLFVLCLLIFLALTSFNVSLFFTRTLLRFSFINKFKPLLDPYLAPYKDKYFIGLDYDSSWEPCFLAYQLLIIISASWVISL